MPKRRKINGKQLLVAAGFAGISLVGCDDAVVANLVAPEDSGMTDAGETSDAGEDAGFPVANLLPPPDAGFDSGAEGTDAGEEVLDAGDPDDAGALEDAGSDAGAPVANLLPPPDSGAAES